MLQLVLGMSGSGKTTLLYKKIKERALEGKRSIVIVPEQFTSSTEARIYHELGDELSGFVESFSFKSLAEELLTVCGGVAIQSLSDAGRAVLVRRAFKELEGNLRYYYHQRKNAAFCQMVSETIDELKSAGLSAEKLSELAPFCTHSKEKISELALVFATYEALLGKAGLDPSDRVNLAAARLESASSLGNIPDFLRDRAIFMDEFDTFNAPKKRLMSALFSAVSSITVALCLDNLGAPPPENSQPTYITEGTLFSGARHIAYELRKIARKQAVNVAEPIIMWEDIRHKNTPALAAVSELLSEPEVDVFVKAKNELTLFGAQTREEEARTVATHIQQLVTNGASYGKIAVVCRDMDTYRTVVRRTFGLMDIPLFCDETTTPEFCAPVTAIKALLAILRGIDYSDQMVTLAKTELCNLTENQVTALENYVYTWSPTMHAWKEPFTRNPEGFESAAFTNKTETEETPLAETARLALCPAIDIFCKTAKDATGAQITKAIYDCLITLGADEKQKTQVSALYKKQGLLTAESATREWNVVMALLDEMLNLLGDEKISPTEYAELFSLLLRSCDLGHIPQTMDAVIFTSAGKMRLDKPDYIFVLGVAEGEFPRAPGENGLLTHADRDALMAQQVELPDCFENEMIREQVCFYKVLTAPEKGLFISWPEGLGLPYSSAIISIAEKLQPQKPNFTPEQIAFTPAAALDKLGATYAENSAQTASLYSALKQRKTENTVNDTIANAMPFIETIAENKPKKLDNLPQIENLLGNELNISPSRLEKYSACPYSYFLQYVIGLRSRQKAELSPNHSGNLMHWVLDKMLSPNASEYDSWKTCAFIDMSKEEIADLADKLTDEYQRLYMPEQSARFSYLLSRLKKSLTGLLIYLQEEQKQSSFKPLATEAKIGFGENCLPPQEYKLDNGKTVRIIGTIDRVDGWTDENGQRWLRVVDYKTGNKNFDLKEVYCGLDCQMLLYLFALVRDESGTFTGAKPAGVLYLLADPIPKESVRENAHDMLRPSLDGLLTDEKAVLTAMDEKGKGEFLPFSHADGIKTPDKKKTASMPKLERIDKHTSTLISDMGKGLYSGDINAMPLCTSAKTQCTFCDFLAVCCHEHGKNERKVVDIAPKEPFAPTEDEDNNTQKGGLAHE